MRSTAIVHITRADCDCTIAYSASASKAGRPHHEYTATCADCGWTESRHVRVILDASGTGLAQQHRRSCPAMAVTA